MSDDTSVRSAVENLRVSDEVRGRLEALLGALRAALGERLVSVLAYGAAVRGEWVDARSDVELALVLRDADIETLESIATPLRVARCNARVECAILIEDEIARAADAFPIYFDDLRRRRVVLYGADPFTSLAVHDEHLRLRIEQELRDAQMRLRRAVADASGAPDRVLLGVIARKVRQVRAPLHALLELLSGRRATHDALRGDRLEDVLDAAGARFDVRVDPLLRREASAVEAHRALSLLLARAVDAVDRFESGGAASG